MQVPLVSTALLFGNMWQWHAQMSIYNSIKPWLLALYISSILEIAKMLQLYRNKITIIILIS